LYKTDMQHILLRKRTWFSVSPMLWFCCRSTFDVGFSASSLPCRLHPCCQQMCLLSWCL